MTQHKVEILWVGDWQVIKKSKIFSVIFFIRNPNGNKALELFCSINMTISFFAFMLQG